MDNEKNITAPEKAIPAPGKPVPAPEKDIPAPEEDITPDTLVEFSRTYTFEGKSYTEVDLVHMDDLTAKDMVAAEKYLFKTGSISALPDQAIGYVCFIASRISDLPIEFFMGLSPRDMNRVKNKVTSFFYGAE